MNFKVGLRRIGEFLRKEPEHPSGYIALGVYYTLLGLFGWWIQIGMMNLMGKALTSLVSVVCLAAGGCYLGMTVKAYIKGKGG